MLSDIFNKKACGIYIGNNAVVLADGSYKDGQWKVDKVSFEIGNTDESSSVDFEKATSKRVEKLLARHSPQAKVLQVAFDDLLIRFFIIAQNDSSSKDKDEQLSLVRWHAKKVLGDVSDYEFSIFRVNDASGDRLYGAAIKKKLLETLEKIFEKNKLLWMTADSAASYRWNSLDAKNKSRDGALLKLGKDGWTLLIWNRRGALMLMKPGRWHIGEDSETMLKKGFIEVHRLISTYIGQGTNQSPEKIYIDSGNWSVSKSQATQVFGGIEVVIREQDAESLRLDEASAPYVQEISSSIEAVAPR